MFKLRAMLLFVVAILLGLAAAVMANRWVKNQGQSAVVTKAETHPVVVAAVDIPFGAKIEKEQLKSIDWPAKQLPEEVFTDIEKVVGRLASQKILQNETILTKMAVESLDGTVLASVVAPSKRAMTVRVNDVIGVAGFLLPGNYVDVIASRKEKDQRVSTRTILENLKVLAVDQTASTEKEQPVVVRAVTLEVSPEEAKLLVQATEEGTVQLALRNPKDSQMLGVDKEPPPLEEAPPLVEQPPAPPPVTPPPVVAPPAPVVEAKPPEQPVEKPAPPRRPERRNDFTVIRGNEIGTQPREPGASAGLAQDTRGMGTESH